MCLFHRWFIMIYFVYSEIFEINTQIDDEANLKVLNIKREISSVLKNILHLRQRNDPIYCLATWETDNIAWVKYIIREIPAPFLHPRPREGLSPYGAISFSFLKKELVKPTGMELENTGATFQGISLNQRESIQCSLYVEIDLKLKLPGMHLNFLLLKSISINSLFFLGGNHFFHKPLVVLYNAIYDAHVNPHINNYAHWMDELFIMRYSTQYNISNSYTFHFRNRSVSLPGLPWQWKWPCPSLCHAVHSLYSSVPISSSYQYTTYLRLEPTLMTSF